MPKLPVVSEPERNDPCWCGSGKKFKKCHYRRQDKTPFGIQDFLKADKESSSSKYCLHPDAGAPTCGGGIVKAHTIQRNGGLNLIARAGHVLQFQNSALPVPENDGAVEVKSVGVRDASTFTGFCSRHDDALFAPLEKSPFEGSPEQIILLGYRALCREVFAKNVAKDHFERLREADRGASVYDQRLLQASLYQRRAAIDLGVKDVVSLKAEFDRALLGHEFSQCMYYVVNLVNCPEIMSSAAVMPTWDFAGRRLQDLEQLAGLADVITFSIIATDLGGAVVWQWMRSRGRACEEFIRSLHKVPKTRMPEALVRFAFEFSENTFFSPQWWEAIPEDQKDRFRRRAMVLPGEHVPSCLVDDGQNTVSWVATSVSTNMTDIDGCGGCGAPSLPPEAEQAIDPRPRCR